MNSRTERPRPQTSPEEARLRLAAIVESSDDAIMSTNLEGIIMSWNAGAEHIFGYKEEEIIGRPVTDLIPPEVGEDEPRILHRIRNGERIDHYETVRMRKDGGRVEISLTVSPIKSEDGRIVGASKIARDITERRRAQRALKEARDELVRANEDLERRVQERTASLKEVITQMEEFSYSVSHDLRAPVRAMQGYARAVLEDYGDRLDDLGRDFLSRIVRSGARMDRLIQDLLTYTRLSRLDVQLYPVSLEKLVRELIQHYPELQSPRAIIAFPGEPLAGVLGNDPSLTQAISNLLNNAVKFVAPDAVPNVEISTERIGNEVRFWVRDNGIGVRPEHQHRLFGMFERVHPDQHYEGTGIGLAIVRRAVERMGGKVGMESDGVNGSGFWIQLPAA